MVMWGVGEDEMKGRHGLLTTIVNARMMHFVFPCMKV